MRWNGRDKGEGEGTGGGRSTGVEQEEEWKNLVTELDRGAQISGISWGQVMLEQLIETSDKACH